MIELRMLGEIRLMAGDGADLDSLLRQPKRLALLAYLASPKPGTWHRRDMLLALFWPEMDTGHARTSLRNSIYVIRQVLGENVLRNRGDEEISIDPSSLKTDVAVVWDALTHHRTDEALANYGGELLPGLFPPDSDGFQRWLDAERTRLQVAVSSAAMARVDEVERAGDKDTALAIARRVISINPDDEPVVRRVMTLHESLDDRAGALAVFESYRARLANDFDAEPAPATVALANRLRESTSAAPTRKKSASSERATASVIELPSLPPKKRLAPIALAALAVVAIIAVTALTFSRGPLPESVGRSTPLTSDEGLQVEVDISPNGRLVAYSKGSSSRLRIFIQTISDGNSWPLSGDSTHVELMPRWSPDNDGLLFLSNNNAYISPTVGGTVRLVARGGEGDAMIRSASWSPAGDSIAIVRNDSLIVQPVRGTGSRFVGRGSQLHSCMWSPTSKWIACVSGNWIAFTPGPLFGNSAPSSIVLFPVAGGKPVDVTGNEHENASPAWSADGKFLWFLSDRDGIPGNSYAVLIGDDGNPSGAPVRTGLRGESISLSTNRIAYALPSKKANLWSIPISRDTAIGMAAATRLTSGNQVVELVSASPDGQWLMYDTNLRGNADIYRIPITGGTPETLTEDSRPEYAADLSVNGEEFAWQRWINGERHLFVKRLDSDSAQEILPVRGDQGVPRWSPDGNSLVAWSHNNERGAVFVMHRNQRGQWLRPAWRLDVGQLPVWSPDGRTIAFVLLNGSVQTIPRDSGAVTTVYAPKSGDPLATYLSWKNPDAIWMLGQTDRNQGVWELSLRTGRTKRLVRLDDPISKSIGPAFTSDGSRFYFALNERSSNVQWAELMKH